MSPQSQKMDLCAILEPTDFILSDRNSHLAIKMVILIAFNYNVIITIIIIYTIIMQRFIINLLLTIVVICTSLICTTLSTFRLLTFLICLCLQLYPASNPGLGFQGSLASYVARFVHFLFFVPTYFQQHLSHSQKPSSLDHKATLLGILLLADLHQFLSFVSCWLLSVFSSQPGAS